MIRLFLDYQTISRALLAATRTCQRKDCRHYRYSDLARDLDERCAHSAAVAAAVDRQQRELDFHAATQDPRLAPRRAVGACGPGGQQADRRRTGRLVRAP